jgi:site-specific DNA-cytosine methylase
VFVIAIFDPVLANRSPSPLLPVAESLPGHLAKGKPQRQSATAKTSTSIGAEGAWWDGRDTAEALTTTSNENRMPDKQKFQAVVVGPLTTHMSSPRGTETSDSNHIVIECYTPSSFANYSEGVGTLRSNGGDLGGGSETLVAEPTMAVRRLTPLECERLMGWPDNHTLTKADNTIQADTHRYKQCGNGVASPVAQWIAKHLLNI